MCWNTESYLAAGAVVGGGLGYANYRSNPKRGGWWRHTWRGAVASAAGGSIRGGTYRFMNRRYGYRHKGRHASGRYTSAGAHRRQMSPLGAAWWLQREGGCADRGQGGRHRRVEPDSDRLSWYIIPALCAPTFVVIVVVYYLTGLGTAGLVLALLLVVGILGLFEFDLRRNAQRKRPEA